MDQDEDGGGWDSHEDITYRLVISEEDGSPQSGGTTILYTHDEDENGGEDGDR